jgi:hypothetical protein
VLHPRFTTRSGSRILQSERISAAPRPANDTGLVRDSRAIAGFAHQAVPEDRHHGAIQIGRRWIWPR